jgi:hypothetical protein
MSLSSCPQTKTKVQLLEWVSKIMEQYCNKGTVCIRLLILVTWLQLTDKLLRAFWAIALCRLIGADGAISQQALISILAAVRTWNFLTFVNSGKEPIFAVQHSSKHSTVTIMIKLRCTDCTRPFTQLEAWEFPGNIYGRAEMNASEVRSRLVASLSYRPEIRIQRTTPSIFVTWFYLGICVR